MCEQGVMCRQMDACVKEILKQTFFPSIHIEQVLKYSPFATFSSIHNIHIYRFGMFTLLYNIYTLKPRLKPYEIVLPIYSNPFSVINSFGTDIYSRLAVIRLHISSFCHAPLFYRNVTQKISSCLSGRPARCCPKINGNNNNQNKKKGQWCEIVRVLVPRIGSF